MPRRGRRGHGWSRRRRPSPPSPQEIGPLVKVRTSPRLRHLYDYHIWIPRGIHHGRYHYSYYLKPVTSSPLPTNESTAAVN